MLLSSFKGTYFFPPNPFLNLSFHRVWKAYYKHLWLCVHIIRVTRGLQSFPTLPSVSTVVAI